MAKNRDKYKGAVLIMVLGMLMLMSIIVSLFLNDIMKDAYLKIQLNGVTQLRHQAYNALNYITSYVEQCVSNSLRIDFSKAGSKEIKLKGLENVKTYVQLTDESGKITLNKKVNLQELKPLFCLFGDIWDGQMLAQSYQIWLNRKAVESQLIELDGWPSNNKKQKSSQKKQETSQPQQEDKKEASTNKIIFPRNLNVYTQLKEIDKFREMFFDEKGNPNEKMERLKNCSSLYNINPININSANKDVLEALSKNFQLDLDQMENYLSLSEYNKSEPKFYQSLKEINTLGHGHLNLGSAKEQNNQTTVQGKQQKDCRGTLSVESSVVAATITVQEADTAFVLKAILFCNKQNSNLTSGKKNGNISSTAIVQIRALTENYL